MIILIEKSTVILYLIKYKTQYLLYTIEDISYIDSHLFDIYDLENETYIIYRSNMVD